MKHRALIPFCAGLLLWAGAAHAQEAITIKLKEGGEGETISVKRRATLTMKTKIEDAQGKVLLDQNETKTEVADFTETILKRQADKPITKRERQYGKMETVKDGKTEAGPLQGKAVVIEKIKDKYAFTYANGDEVTGPAAAALAEDFDAKGDALDELDKLVFPKQAVKVGETWKVDMGPIVKVFNKNTDMQVDPAKATGSGKLLKVYDKDGKQFGALSFKIEMALVTSGAGKDEIKFGPGAKMVIDATYDTCIDGGAETGSIKMKTLITGAGTFVQMPGSVVTMYSLDEVFDSHEETGKKK